MSAEIDGAIRSTPQAVWRAEFYHLILHFICCCRLQISCCDSFRLCPPYCSQITENASQRNDRYKQHHLRVWMYLFVYWGYTIIPIHGKVLKHDSFVKFPSSVCQANRLSNWLVRFGYMLCIRWPLNDKINLIVSSLIAFLWLLQLPVVWMWPSSACNPLPWLDSVAEP